MKIRILIIMMFISCYAFGQREYTTADITTINSGLTAAEGDFYRDTLLNILYLGMIDGSLWSVTDTDKQDLSLTGNTLAISNDPNTDVDLSPYLDNTDAQDLTLSGNTLAISNDPNTDVDLSGYVNTDAQDLTLTGNTLAISNDPNTDVDLSPYLDNTDDQKIDVFSFDGTTLSLSLESDLEATKTLNLSSVDKNIYDDDGTLAGNRTVTMNGNNLTFDGTADVIIQNNGSLGVGTITPDARLDVEGGTVRFSDYGVGTNTGTDTYQLAVDADGDVVEMNTVISSKIFYPPAVVIDVSMTGTGLSLDLHQEYVDRFGTPAVKNPTAPAAIPTYSETELDYYVTDYDTTVFANVSVSNAGIMTYDVIAVPASNCTYVNVVFVVK